MPIARRRPFVLALALALMLQGGCRGDPPPAPASERPSSVGAAASAPAPSTPAARRLPAGRAEPPRVALGVRGAVAAHEAHAADVGLAILQQGGNAVDAAVAVGFALAVTHPAAGNIGGGGFMIVRMADGRAEAIDYREAAPGKAHRDMYLEAGGEVGKDSLVGARAAGIPGTVAGLGLAHQRFGKLPWREVVMPAVALARDGHSIDEHHAKDLALAVGKMKGAGFDASAFTGPDGALLAAGATWRQPALAATLERIATGGAAVFYRDMAASLVAEVRARGGIWELADLTGYRAIVREPIRFSYRGHEIITMPPPSGGGVVLRQIFFAAEAHGMAELAWPSADAVHLYIEATRRAYADRNALIADPDHVTVPLAQLLDPAYLTARMAPIALARATPSAEIRAGMPVPRESEQTTHFSIIDAEGNAVANTYTLNSSFGAKLWLPESGVLLNNEMDDFSAKPGSANLYGLVQGEANAIAPGKRMLSSMTPTIVLADGQVRAVVGSPGGPTITTTVAQIVFALVEQRLPIDAAVAAPRVHHQWLPDTVFVEEAVPQPLRAALRARGHHLEARPPIGHANCIEVDPATGGFRAVADVARDGGKAAAY
jgi:gamma-glutamyltranspeptidase/glutathione hydrolase